MKFILHTLLVATILFGAGRFPSAARADEIDELVTKLRKAVEAAPQDSEEKRAAIERSLVELEAMIVAGNEVRAQEVGRRIATTPNLGAEATMAAESLILQLPRFLQARADRFVADVDGALERTRKECPPAKTELDLDPLFRELTHIKQRQPRAEGSPLVARSVRKLESALKLVETWMDYLAERSQEKKGRATDALRQILREPSAYPILQADEIETQLGLSGKNAGNVSDVLSILARIKTLKDVDVVAPDIEAIPARTENSMNGEVDALQRWFRSFHAAAAAYLSGDFGDAWRRISLDQTVHTDRWVGEILRLRSMLADDLIARIMKMPPDAMRRPDETSIDHVRRLVADAIRDGRWEEVRRYANTRSSLPASTRSLPNPYIELGTAVGNYLQGRRFEEVGDIAAAIPAYESVLRTTADFAPVPQAIERLKALRASHPDAFREAHERVDADRALQLIQRLEVSISDLQGKLSAFEAQRKTIPPTPTPSPPRDVGLANAQRSELDTKLAQVAATGQKINQLNERLERLEVLLGPGAEALTAKAPDDKKLKIWLASDFTVYRSALPPKLESNLAWIVRFNGKTVLGRNAEREFFYRYHNLKPGNYSVFLTLDHDTPASNTLDFTISEQQARSLRKIEDPDWDRDGVPNAEESENR